MVQAERWAVDAAAVHVVVVQMQAGKRGVAAALEVRVAAVQEVASAVVTPAAQKSLPSYFENGWKGPVHSLLHSML